MENEEDMEMGDFSSNLDGYLGNKGETRNNEIEESLDKNVGLENIGDEDINQSGKPQKVREENVEEDLGKEKELEKDVEKGKDDPSFGVMLSFLDIAKLKVNSSLHGDS